MTGNQNTDELECDVYKSIKKENYYVFVIAGDELSRVPEALQQQLGEMEVAVSFTLTAERSLAKEDPMIVMRNLREQGYHLQLPPVDDKRPK